MSANGVGVASIPEYFEAHEVVVRQLFARPVLRWPALNLSGATATGAGDAIFTGDKGMVQWICRPTAVTTGGVVLIEGCDKNSGAAADWYTIATFTVTANKAQYAVVTENETHQFMRSNLSTRTDGTYTTLMLYKDYPGKQIGAT